MSLFPYTRIRHTPYLGKINTYQRLNKKLQGVTLVELMIVIAIFSLAFTLVGPNIRYFLAKNQLSSAVNQRSGLMQRARLFAIEQATTVSICPANDYSTCSKNWSEPLIAFVDQNTNGMRDNNETIIYSAPLLHPSIIKKGPRNKVRFYESGISATPASFKFCIHLSQQDYLISELYLSLQGRLRVNKTNKTRSFLVCH